MKFDGYASEADYLANKLQVVVAALELALEVAQTPRKDRGGNGMAISLLEMAGASRDALEAVGEIMKVPRNLQALQQTRK